MSMGSLTESHSIRSPDHVEYGAGAVDALVQRDGDLLGILSEADYAHAMTIQRGFRSGVAG